LKIGDIILEKIWRSDELVNDRRSLCFNLPGIMIVKYEKLIIENLEGEFVWKRN